MIPHYLGWGCIQNILEMYSENFLAKGFHIVQLEALNLIASLQALCPQHPEKYNIVINTDKATSQIVLPLELVEIPYCVHVLDQFGSLRLLIIV